MIKLIKWLLGINDKPSESSYHVKKVTTRYNDDSKGSSDKYFDNLGMLQEALSKRDYGKASDLTVESLKYITPFVQSEKRQYGSFNIRSIPSLESGGNVLALMGMKNELEEMKNLVNLIPDLKPWKSIVDEHIENIELISKILVTVNDNPNCLQTDVKNLIDFSDGKRIANILYWLDKTRNITRIKKGRTYSLILSGQAKAPNPIPKKNILPHRMGKKSGKCKEINLSKLEYIPLPRAPHHWEDSKGKKAPKPIKPSTDWFEIRDNNVWKIHSIEKTPNQEKPDPAFRKLHPLDDGILFIDDLGNSELSPNHPVAILKFNKNGIKQKEAPLEHDIYRLGINPLGSGFICMSREGVVHAYDNNINRILETSIINSPEINSLRKRFNIDDEALKNYIRTISLSYDRSRYLYTGVDEAWCIDLEGNWLWGVKLPIKEGREKVVENSEKYGTSEEVMQALNTLEMTLPFTPEELKGKYRSLAKKWHPDLNPNNPSATDKMKEITNAVELLTGIDSNALPTYTKSTFMQKSSEHKLSKDGVEFTSFIGIQASESFASDWIYASSFAGKNNNVYLAGYSGRIIQLDSNGTPIRAYDIGAVPYKIIDTGDYIYFLTDTRLYVLRKNALIALVDVLEAGELIMAQTGFGLLQKKHFEWFTDSGKRIGGIVTKNPIRRVYYSPNGMIVETRQRRATIAGVKTWWE